MIRKLDVPEFKSEAEEAEWWDRHREETARWMEDAVAAGQTTTPSAALKRMRKSPRPWGSQKRSRKYSTPRA